MARDYGWTLSEIDAVDRPRVLEMWAVRTIYTQAEEYNRKFERAARSFEQNAQYIPTVRPEPDVK
jgi:hypothetical protein